MSRHPSLQALPCAKRVAERVFSAVERYLHVEAVSGVVLLVTAAASYEHFWHLLVTLRFADYIVSESPHFWSSVKL